MTGRPNRYILLDMSPNAPHEQSQDPASLPAMPAPSPVQATAPITTQAGPVAPAPLPAEPPMDVTLQAEQLVARYAGDPYQLSEAFGQLKSAYLLHYHHITTNPAGN